ncbi:MAG: hypothetical protein DRG50_06750 [Deltaproteobacteria bacterium]|nr:MAG: hypothetical protein DRG50_06750 [Deltaproteobacteria bacterium]
MAIIAPFRGLYYNPEKVDDLSLVVTPPYDIITPEQQKRYRQRHAYNMIHLILPEGGVADRYKKASNHLREWEKEGILIREKKPSIYPYQQIFTSPSGKLIKREGFVVLVRLEPLELGSIIPHEHTTNNAVEDRLKLMEACSANLSPVFALYPDPEKEIEGTLAEIWTLSPRYEFKDDSGITHRLWQLDDQKIMMEISKKMQDKTLLIADGHHRYKTALIYRDRMRRRYSSYSETSPFEYTMMYLSPMEGEGVFILPTHRLVLRRNPFDLDGFYSKLRRYFFFQIFDFRNPSTEKMVRKTFLETLDETGRNRYTFGLYIRGEQRYLILTLREGVKVGDLLKGYPQVLRELDVSLLDEFILKKLLKLSDIDVGLTKDRDEALEEVQKGNYEMAFLLTPPSIQQVKKITEAGEVMPRKTTYFYPKVATGLVIYKIVPEEEVELV